MKRKTLAQHLLDSLDKQMMKEHCIPFMKGYRNGKNGIYNNKYKTIGFEMLYDRGYNLGLTETITKKTK